MSVVPALTICVVLLCLLSVSPNPFTRLVSIFALPPYLDISFSNIFKRIKGGDLTMKSCASLKFDLSIFLSKDFANECLFADVTPRILIISSFTCPFYLTFFFFFSD